MVMLHLYVKCKNATMTNKAYNQVNKANNQVISYHTTF